MYEMFLMKSICTLEEMYLVLIRIAEALEEIARGDKIIIDSTNTDV